MVFLVPLARCSSGTPFSGSKGTCLVSLIDALAQRVSIKLNKQILHAAGESELWPGRDLLPHWKPAQETLHANTCMILFFSAAMLIIYPRIRPWPPSLIGVLLLLGAGWVPCLIWRLVHAWVAGLPQEVPEGHTWSQLAVNIFVHAPAHEALQTWDYAGRCLQSCLTRLSLSASGNSLRQDQLG